jgi:hypothetical protein
MVAGAGRLALTHDELTAKYTYNEHVFKVFVERCSRCHVDGAVGPMSLMTYEDALPWAGAIRSELPLENLGLRTADAPFVHQAHTSLSPSELDTIVDWASGGTPQGDRSTILPAVRLSTDWPLGPPDLALPLPQPHTVEAGVAEETREFVVPLGLAAARRVRVVDILPGNPAVVREVAICVRAPSSVPSTAGGCGVGTPGILALWTPTQTASPATLLGAREIPARSELFLSVHYKKTWTYLGKAVSDRSTVGVYFEKVGSQGSRGSLGSLGSFGSLLPPASSPHQ